MSKRLQVVLDEQDLKQMKRAAASENQSLSQWVRRALRDRIQLGKKKLKQADLKVLRDLKLPSPPIDQLLSEIESGRK